MPVNGRDHAKLCAINQLPEHTRTRNFRRTTGASLPWRAHVAPIILQPQPHRGQRHGSSAEQTTMRTRGALDIESITQCAVYTHTTQKQPHDERTYRLTHLIHYRATCLLFDRKQGHAGRAQARTSGADNAADALQTNSLFSEMCPDLLHLFGCDQRQVRAAQFERSPCNPSASRTRSFSRRYYACVCAYQKP